MTPETSKLVMQALTAASSVAVAFVAKVYGPIFVEARHRRSRARHELAAQAAMIPTPSGLLIQACQLAQAVLNLAEKLRKCEVRAETAERARDEALAMSESARFARNGSGGEPR